jgi:hypothetical protein
MRKEALMKAPSKGTGYLLEDYGMVLVKAGPSPEHPFVWVSAGYVDGEEQFESIHIDDFKRLRIR